MTDEEKIITALRNWDAARSPRSPDLRQITGLSAGSFARAANALRQAGKIEWDRLELRPSMRMALANEADGDGAVFCEARQFEIEESSPASLPEALSIKQQVDAEVAAQQYNKKMAKRTGGTRSAGAIDLSLLRDGAETRGHAFGSCLQDLALRDDVLAAASALRVRWNDVWVQICAAAKQAGLRPVPMMVVLLEKALSSETELGGGGLIR